MATSTSTTPLGQPHTLVIGGGWAGLSAAVKLAQQGCKVTLLESARQLGGRARRVAFEQNRVDNGQHLLLGAYTETLNIMRLVGIEPDEQFLRHKLLLTLHDPKGKDVVLKAPKLPAPLHLFIALLACSGLSLRERLRALQFGLRLFMHGFILPDDMPVQELLLRYKQPENLIKRFWSPLCLAIMNTPAEDASAHVFIRVLHDSFRKDARFSDLLFARADLGSLLPDPAMEYIEAKHGSIKLGQRATGLILEGDRCQGVHVDDQTLTADHVVIATTASACHNLISDHGVLHSLSEQLAQFSYQPICTIYLQYPAEVSTGEPMVGLLGGHGQWLFDRRLYEQPGLMAVVISGDGPHMELDNARLIKRIQCELASHYPDWPAPLDAMVIREKRATFTCHAGINRLRPECKTPVQGLWLAGDYTNTGYPATLEGAVRSGLECARHITETVPSPSNHQ